MSPAAKGRPNTVVIKGGLRGPSVTVLRDVVSYRSVFFALVKRGITTRFRQSIGGPLWLIAGPLTSALTYTVFLGGVAGLKGDSGTDYILFALVGTVMWGTFQRGGIGGMGSLVGNSTFVKKVYFPRVYLPMASVGQSVADLIPSAVMMFVVALVVGQSASPDWILVIVPIATVMVFSAAFAIVFSAINVYYRDLTYASALITQLGMFASAVVFPLSQIDEDFRTAYGIFNPIAGSIDTARTLVYRGDGINFTMVGGGIAWTLLLLFVALMIFSVLERNAADQI